MKRNEGKIDRIIRAVIGIAALIGAVLIGWKATGIFLGSIAIVALFTATTGFCALYKLLGINTCSSTKEKTQTECEAN